MMKLSDILQTHGDELALILGNGIHLAGGGRGNSWRGLLLDLANKSGLNLPNWPSGLSNIEFFDVLALQEENNIGEMAKQFCDAMSDWQVNRHHRSVMSWAVKRDVPVLTTNFDTVLSDAAKAPRQRTKHAKFVSYYPWDTRFAHQLHDDPCAGFGVWHINGMACYPRSIRLGLSHYVGLAQRARGWMQQRDTGVFKENGLETWRGRHTWLQIVFKRPLLIFGLGLREDEVFLRWLLIERARYFAKFPALRQDAWYVYKNDPKDKAQEGHLLFLSSVGFNCIRVEDHSEIYDDKVWSS
ncbi:SIR2 family protein [Novosphingobium sp.]|jgi:hypothetical protein|uniref:SIR2 family protein n=1 Tax=Novosphingobium sp. TaxID=1874826 RepID=UPI002FDFF5F9